jgi:glutathione synthase/RimK-type ligase-like ATP-grasp enzyme
MSTKNILFIRGIEDSNTIYVKNIDPKGQMDISLLGNVDLFSQFEDERFTKTRITLDTSPHQEIAIASNIDAIFNQITEPDTQHAVLSKIGQIYHSYQGKVPFFNIPSAIQKTYRDTAYRLLHDLEKIHYPKTVKFTPRSAADIYRTIVQEGFTLPVLLRPAGLHGGYDTQLIEDTQEAFYTVPLDGRAYYLTQFSDFEQNGLYTKYRFIVVDGEVFIRHVIFSDQWKIQGEEGRVYMKEHPELQKKAEDTMRNFETDLKPHIQPLVTQIHTRIGLDYFGIDCSLDTSGDMLVFEINASMYLKASATRDDSFHQPYIEKIQNALVEMIADRTIS